MTCTVFQVCKTRVQQTGKIKHGCTLIGDLCRLCEHIRTSNHFIHRPEAQRSHILSYFLCHKLHEMHHIFRLTAKAAAQLLILRRNAKRTGISGAYPHHTTAQCDQCDCCKSIFFCSQQCRNNNIPARHQTTIGFQYNSVPKAVTDQRLMCLRDTQFPRQTGMMNRTDRRSTRASIIS